MNKNEAITIITKYTSGPIVSANGHISRELFNVNDINSNFYMIGSMGLSSSIGLGLALANPKKQIFVLDGDGNILMNLGSLTTIGSIKPRNLIHFVLDNGIHASTGGQPTNTNTISIEKIAKAANYKVFRTSNKNYLKKLVLSTKKMLGPIMIVIKITKNQSVGRRVDLEPITIRNRFMKSLHQK